MSLDLGSRQNDEPVLAADDLAVDNPARYRLRLLDGFHLEHDGRPLRTPLSVRRVVAFLGVHGRTGRAEMAGTLWPEVPEHNAHASLRTVLWRLNRLGATPLIAGQDTLALTPAVHVDVRQFVTAARRILTQDAPPGAATMPLLGATGELLPGWYEDWVLFERERLRQLRMHALEALAGRLTAARRHAEAIEAALAAVRLEPLRESATRALITAHLAENNVVEAVRQFETFRAVLSTELGVQPTAELQRLVPISRRR